MDFLWFIRDGTTGLPVSGSDEYTSISVRRAIDGYLYNWNTGSFSVSGGSAPSKPYLEVPILSGLYIKTVDVSGWDNGTYHEFSYLDTPELALTRATEFIIRGGAPYESSSEIALINMPTPPAATLLVQEYYNNQDADGNGLIYGIDFYISTDIPKILEQIPKRGVPLSWTEYLESI